MPLDLRDRAAALISSLGEEEHLNSVATQLVERLAEFGITRIAETTRLDRLGLRTHSAIKPGTTDVISVYSGKGHSVSDSIVSAIMECVERTGAMWDERRVVRGAEREIRKQFRCAPPTAFTEFLGDYSDASSIAWVAAQDVRRGAQCMVPAHLAFAGREPESDRAFGAEFARTTNGLGAHFNREAAIAHALKEVIERDAVSCIELQASHFDLNALLSLAQGLGIDVGSKSIRDSTEKTIGISVETLPSGSRAALARARDEGLQVHVHALLNDMRVPCYACACVEDVGGDRYLASAGYAAGFPAEDALDKAFLEMCQSRATHFQGAREDDGAVLEKQLMSRATNDGWLFQLPASVECFETNRKRFVDDVDSADAYIKRLESVGLDDVYVVSFEPHPGIYVVRVLVPGAETWHATAGESRLGRRMSRVADERGFRIGSKK